MNREPRETTTIYLAGRYVRREELCRYADDLRAAGHEVTSRWLLGEHQWDGGAVEIARAYENGENPPEAVGFAQDDVEDLARSEVVISFTETPRETFTEADVRAALAYPVGDPSMHGYEIWDMGAAVKALNRTAGKAARGGRHVEFGMGWAWGKRLIVVGPRENVFHLLPTVEQFDSWPDALAALADLAAFS